MEMKRKRTHSLSMLLLGYLTLFCVLIITIMLLALFGFSMGLNSGFLLPPSHSEQALQKAGQQLIQSRPFDPSAVPYPCSYVLFGADSRLISSSMSKKALTGAIKYLAAQSTPSQQLGAPEPSGASGPRYRQLVRTDGTRLIVEYDIRAHFANPKLDKLFLKPEELTILLFFVCFILIAVCITMKFSKKLKMELDPLIGATTSITQRNLDFESVPTHIREFNTVLQSIDELKSALTSSLKEQWEMEQHKKLLLSAVTHDIKTPLTIIKGNAELLLENRPASADQELLQYIQISSNKIEAYLNLLITTAAAGNDAPAKRERFSVSDLAEEIEKQGAALCRIKHLTLSVTREKLPETFCGDSLLISSAVTNILDNGAEHSPEGGCMTLEIAGDDSGSLSFTVSDWGTGFSNDGLNNAAAEFYTEHKERSGAHYGLGLSIAKTVAETHGGQLSIENRKEGSGAIVRLTLNKLD